MTTPQHTRPARLYRSRDDRVVAGVAGGLARYLAVDPVLVRIVFVALALAAGSGVLAYLIAWVVVPEEPGEAPVETAAPAAPRPESSGRARLVVGIALVLIGAGLLLEWALPALHHAFWPVVVIAAGAFLFLQGMRR